VLCVVRPFFWLHTSYEYSFFFQFFEAPQRERESGGRARDGAHKNSQHTNTKTEKKTMTTSVDVGLLSRAAERSPFSLPRRRIRPQRGRGRRRRHVTITRRSFNELEVVGDDDVDDVDDDVFETEKEEEEEEEEELTTTTIEPFVLRETEDILAVYKPANLGFHSEFQDGLVKRLRKLKENDEHFYECENIYPVHRLDKPTSGIVLFATKKSVAKSLSRAFESKQIVKYYVGVSERKPRKKMGTVKGDLKKARRGMYKLMRTQENPSKTTFVSRGFTHSSVAEVEENCSEEEEDSYSYKAREKKTKPNTNLRFFLFKPETGKTHQLRVHAKSLGSALLGDKMYGNTTKSNGIDIDRMYLHACAIRVPRLKVEEESEENYNTEPFQLVCPPKEGKYWGPDAFQEWFGDDQEEEYGPWFDDITLLRSALDTR
jgi:tRNA pseudouridine32 synthase/23S rRNA pseudouridine746 synthase